MQLHAPSARKWAAIATASAAPLRGRWRSRVRRAGRASGHRLRGDAVHVDDVRGEAGEVGLDRLRVSDVGVDGVEERERGGVGGHGQSGLRHQCEAGLWSCSATVLPPVLGPLMMSCARVRLEREGSGTADRAGSGRRRSSRSGWRALTSESRKRCGASEEMRRFFASLRMTTSEVLCGQRER